MAAIQERSRGASPRTMSALGRRLVALPGEGDLEVPLSGRFGDHPVGGAGHLDAEFHLDLVRADSADLLQQDLCSCDERCSSFLELANYSVGACGNEARAGLDLEANERPV